MSDTSPLNSRPAGYHDFGGLASLRGEAAQGTRAAIRETATQFEAYFIQNMMKTMREAMEKSDLTDTRDADTFQDLMDKEVAVKMAERGALGLADMIERNLAQRLQPTAHEALSAREKAWPPSPQALPMPGAPAGLPMPPRLGGSLPLKMPAGVKGQVYE
jgi:flagellar protein FlgJ